MEAICEFFKSIGMPLEHLPEGEGWKEMWQHDGDIDGYLVQISTGVNGHGKKGIFGDVTGPNGDVIEISCCADSWMEDMPEWVVQFVS